MFHILEGVGGIQVDFKNHHDWSDKLIFLEKGQYIKFLTDQFVVRRIEFQDEVLFRHPDVRVLFKHLVSLGYINFSECSECQEYLSKTVLDTNTKEIIDISSRQWFWQNPFNANKDEYHIIFDVKQVIDEQFRHHLTNRQLSDLLHDIGYDVHSVYKQKVGLTIKGAYQRKRLLESQKSIAFEDKSIKEIAYEMGFKDPAYFNRAFKQQVGASPNQFRENIAYTDRDTFIQDLYDLLQRHHKEQHSVGFYADQMHLSKKALSKKVAQSLQVSIGQLIRQEIINTARLKLKEGHAIKSVAAMLSFDEAHHFSAFFKHYTGQTPTAFLA